MIDPQSNGTVGFHLFFEPEGGLKKELSEIIEKLAKEYDGPVFTPHVTLLARIPSDSESAPVPLEAIIEKSQSLAKSLSPFTLTLGRTSTENAYFKALYLHIKEQTEMRVLHAQALEHFFMDDEAPYLPHLSLLYGKYPQEQKEVTIESLVLPTEHSFVVKSLYLYQTEGEVHDWKLIQEFPFGE
ncbi:MAG: cyclic phosphodiesterase-like protein [Parcubacteria group bacterium]|nr:cyclic phosphodiesterase-like protein [Parcubacteria group bacterium]